MPRFGVRPEKEQELVARMERCGLCENDLEESFIQGGGPGGQKVNKSASCVLLKHIPSGLAVKVQAARSQALNRFYARRRLCALLERRVLGEASAESLRRAHIRKQKERRKRRSRAQKDAGQGDASL